mmetsp:Transcript_2005/g.5047  ORF Transcript_2005/g.5047 Transcript_2005/m.5047 type:complete len:165 (+) Transcript_2005:83-577(+)
MGSLPLPSRQGALAGGGDVAEGWYSLEAAREVAQANPEVGGFTWRGPPDAPEDTYTYVHFKPPGQGCNQDAEWSHQLMISLPEVGGGSRLEAFPGALVAGGDIAEGWYSLEEACRLLLSDARMGGFCWHGVVNEAGQVYAHFKPPAHAGNEDADWTRVVLRADT